MSCPYCSFSCTVFSCASGSAYLGSSLLQEVREKAANITKAILQSFICFHFDIMFLLNCLQMILLPTDLLMDGTKPKQEQTEWMLFFS
jgi:hypothetical protein